MRSADVLSLDPVDFSELALSDAVVRGLRDAGFVRPSPIQLAAIPLGRFGVDLIAKAKSGTGKTAAFAVIALEAVLPGKCGPQALVVSPTRELAMQTADVCRRIGGHIAEIRVSTFIGGTPMRCDMSSASQCELACGTPGRLVALLLNEAMLAERVRMLVLDEADKLAEDDFEPQLRYLLTALPARKQTLAFSATYPPALLAALRSVMRTAHCISVIPSAADSFEDGGGSACTPERARSENDPLFDDGDGGCVSRPSAANVPLSCGVEGSESSRDAAGFSADGGWGDDGRAALLGVKQFFTLVRRRSGARPKWERTIELLDSLAFHQALVFCNDRLEAPLLADSLNAAGFPAAAISGANQQSQRTATVRRFRAFSLRILVCSDLLARGVDFGRVSLVIHLQPPKDVATYLHRVGRTGRFGSLGASIMVVTGSEWLHLSQLFRQHMLQVAELPSQLSEELYLQQPSFTAEEAKQLGYMQRLREEAQRGPPQRTTLDNATANEARGPSEHPPCGSKSMMLQANGCDWPSLSHPATGSGLGSTEACRPADAAYEELSEPATPLLRQEVLEAARARGRQKALERARERVHARRASSQQVY